MSNIIIFLQRHGSPEVEELEVALSATVAELYTSPNGGIVAEEVMVFLDEGEEPIDRHTRIEECGARHGSRIHVSHCRHVEVTVHFQEKTETHRFAPGAKVHRVKQCAVHKFGLAETDATEHVLQICGGVDRPAGDTSLHTLLAKGTCGLCFDLVPEKRVEGQP